MILRKRDCRITSLKNGTVRPFISIIWWINIYLSFFVLSQICTKTNRRCIHDLCWGIHVSIWIYIIQILWNYILSLFLFLFHRLLHRIRLLSTWFLAVRGGSIAEDITRRGILISRKGTIIIDVAIWVARVAQVIRIYVRVDKDISKRTLLRRCKILIPIACRRGWRWIWFRTSSIRTMFRTSIIMLLMKSQRNLTERMPHFIRLIRRSNICRKWRGIWTILAIFLLFLNVNFRWVDNLLRQFILNILIFTACLFVLTLWFDTSFTIISWYY